MGIFKKMMASFVKKKGKEKGQKEERLLFIGITY